MADRTNPMASIEAIFHKLADMNLTKKNRAQIAQMLASAVCSGCEAAGDGDEEEAIDKALFMARECSK